MQWKYHARQKNFMQAEEIKKSTGKIVNICFLKRWSGEARKVKQLSFSGLLIPLEFNLPSYYI